MGKDDDRAGQLRSYALILFAAALTTALLYLSWERLGASVRFLAVDTAIDNYWESGAIEPAQVDALIERADEVIALHDHHRYWEALSQLQTLSGMDENRPFEARREVLEQSLESAREVVSQAPARPGTWLRMARTAAFLGHPRNEVIAAWRTSVLTGRVEPPLMRIRLELGFHYYPALDGESLRLLRDQLLLAWKIDRRGVVASLADGRLDRAKVNGLLAGYADDVLAEMMTHPRVRRDIGA